VALGKAVRSAVSSGRHEITNAMRRTRSIGQNIERCWKINEVQIPGTKDALYRAFLDSLGLCFLELRDIDRQTVNEPGPAVLIAHDLGLALKPDHASVTSEGPVHRP
jgi:hypothetical protein